jgi:hypothetical protein
MTVEIGTINAFLFRLGYCNIISHTEESNFKIHITVQRDEIISSHRPVGLKCLALNVIQLLDSYIYKGTWLKTSELAFTAVHEVH